MYLSCLERQVFFLTEHENALKGSQDGAEDGAQLLGMYKVIYSNQDAKIQNHLAQESQQQ